jgi:hypothetical protein
MTHRERLERLLFLLEQEQEKPPVARIFDITEWEGHCGTSACAVGIACMDPVLKAEGLHLGETPHGVYLVPMFEGFVGFDAAREFFGLGHFSDALRLFDGDEYPTPDDVEISEVIERIEETLEK